MINRYYQNSEFEYKKLTAPVEVAPSLVSLLNDAIISADEGKCVLEIGCGTGSLSEHVSAKGLHYKGIDVSPSAIEVAQRSYPSGNFERADFLNWNSSEEFDYIVDGHTLHCLIGSDRENYLRNVVEHLKPKGRFVLETMITSKNLLFPSNYLYESGVLNKEVSTEDYYDALTRGERRYIPYRTIVDNLTLEKEILDSGLKIIKLLVPFGTKLTIDDLPAEHSPDVLKVICERS